MFNSFNVFSSFFSHSLRNVSFPLECYPGNDHILSLFPCCAYSVGHNEVIGVCRVGNDADSLGREHWSEMLTYPRKPVAHWHPIVEVS